mgnify:FL=1
MVNFVEFVLDVVNVIEDAGGTRKLGHFFSGYIVSHQLSISRSIPHFRLGVVNGWF